MTVGRLEGMNDAIDEFPGLKARTLRFTCGAPRSARAIGDGSRALFLRSDGPEDTVTSLWMSVIGSDGDTDEILLADPRTLLADADAEDVPAEEKARRERAREGGSGIVGYSVDAAGNRVTFTINGQLFLTDIAAGVTRGIAIDEAELRTADEIWLTSSGKEVLGVVTLDGQPVGHGEQAGKPGPVTRQMHAWFCAFRDEFMRHGHD